MLFQAAVPEQELAREQVVLMEQVQPVAPESVLGLAAVPQLLEQVPVLLLEPPDAVSTLVQP